MRKKSFHVKFDTLIGVFLTALCVTVLFLPGVARAHVKWFAPYDVAKTPVDLHGVLNPTFMGLLVLTLMALWALCALERTATGEELLASVDEVFAPIRGAIDTLIRAGSAAFFVAIWAHGGIILTPELTTSSAAAEWLQAAIAAGLLFRATLPLSALGIVILFAQGVWAYGLFHMMDYPIFLGVAACFVMSGLGWRSFLGARPLDLIRIGAAVTSNSHFGADACFFVILRRDRRIGSGTYPRIIAPKSDALCRFGSSGHAGG
ncbi:MAG: hypothetical protein EXR07_18670, partial [Acetobacteraceae bacterium]|nr:hypothetical protein [Acetobacteraceae bacterium]